MYIYTTTETQRRQSIKKEAMLFRSLFHFFVYSSQYMYHRNVIMETLEILSITSFNIVLALEKSFVSVLSKIITVYERLS